MNNKGVTRFADKKNQPPIKKTFKKERPLSEEEDQSEYENTGGALSPEDEEDDYDYGDEDK